VAAADEAEAADEVAAGAEPWKETTMRSQVMKVVRHRRIVTALAIGALTLTASALGARGATSTQQNFASPDEAVQVLAAAIKAGDKKAMLAVLGPQAKPLIDSGDAVADRASWDRFTTAYEQAHTLVKSGDAMVLEVGSDQWPLPIPLVEKDGRWHFDTAAGEQEIIDRRIGRNELAAIQVSLAFVDAQREYYLRNPQNAKLAQYAQQVASTPGKRDGLYWPTNEDEPPSPLGPLVARARGEGYKQAGSGRGAPYHGYYYRILKAQGPDATGGAYGYVAHGAMIGGFALVAYPAEYGSSGVMTFLVNHDGVVFEKDLGPDTAATARAMTKFNPDSTWKRVSDSDASPASTAASPAS
jgi:hypothetical protein